MSKREGRERDSSVPFIFIIPFKRPTHERRTQSLLTCTRITDTSKLLLSSIARCKARTRRGGVDLGHSACDENRHAHTKTRSRAKEKSLFFGNNFVEHKRARWENERRKKLLVSLTSCASKSSRETKEDQEKETLQHVHI